MTAAFLPLAALLGSLNAVSDEPAGAPAEERSPWTTSIGLRGTEIFKSNLSDGPGSVSIARVGVDVNLGYAVSSTLRLGLSVDTEASYYNFTNATGLFPGSGTGEPFNDVYSTTLTPIATYIIDKQWSIFGGGLLQFAGEPEADIGDSFTGGGFFGARYAFSDTFALRAQVIAVSRLEDDALIIVAPGIEWQVSPTVSLATEKLGLRIKAKLSPDWTASLFGSYEIREFRLADDSPLSSGVVRDRSLPIGVDLTYAPTANIDISLRGGAIVYQKYEIDNANGDRVSDDKTDPAPFVGLAVKFSF